SFARALLVEAKFDSADLIAADFSSARLFGASFVNSNLQDSRFDYALFDSGTTFDGADLEGASIRTDISQAELLRACAEQNTSLPDYIKFIRRCPRTEVPQGTPDANGTFHLFLYTLPRDRNGHPLAELKNARGQVIDCVRIVSYHYDSADN